MASPARRRKHRSPAGRLRRRFALKCRRVRLAFPFRVLGDQGTVVHEFARPAVGDRIEIVTDPRSLGSRLVRGCGLMLEYARTESASV